MNNLLEEHLMNIIGSYFRGNVEREWQGQVVSQPNEGFYLVQLVRRSRQRARAGHRRADGGLDVLPGRRCGNMRAIWSRQRSAQRQRSASARRTSAMVVGDEVKCLVSVQPVDEQGELLMSVMQMLDRDPKAAAKRIRVLGENDLAWQWVACYTFESPNWETFCADAAAL